MDLNTRFKLKKSNIVIILCIAILFITSWAPMMKDSPLGTPLQRTLLNYVVWVCVAVGFLISRKRRGFSLFEITAMVAVFVYRAYHIIYSYEPFKGLGITAIVIGLFFCYQVDEIRACVFKYFKYIMVAVSIVGIICYISYFFNLGIPFTIVYRDDGIPWFNYKICYLMTHSNLVRFNGFFEEPGWFGTWAAFFLCADDINLKKKENIILLIAGFLTLSLAFVLLLIIYYILKNLSDWKRWGWLVALVLLYILVIPNITTGNPVVDRLLERMTITSGGLVGDNRHGLLFARLWDQTINSNDIYFGHGAGYAEYFGTGIGEGLASIKSYIVNFGIIGTTIIFVPIFVASIIHALNSNNKLMVFYILISYISLYQRPVLFGAPHFIVFLCGVSYTGMLAEKDAVKAVQ